MNKNLHDKFSHGGDDMDQSAAGVDDMERL